MKNRFVLMLLILLAPTILWATTTNRTHIRTLTGSEPANLFVFNTNFLNLRATADAIYNDAGTPLNTNLYLWTNSIHGILNLIGTGSGIVTGFTEFFVGTIKVSTITAGTGTVSAVDIASWNSNLAWYIQAYTNIAYWSSNNIFSASNTFSAITHHTADVNMHSNSITDIEALIFTNMPNLVDTATAGMLWYDADNGFSTRLGSYPEVTPNLGFETLVVVRNDTGSVLTNGTVVYIKAAPHSGVGQDIAVDRAYINGDTTTEAVLGLMTMDTGDGSNGVCTVRGLVNGLNTAHYTNNTILYLGQDSGNAGVWTNAASEVVVGVVKRSHETTGQIFVNPYRCVICTVTNEYPYLLTNGINAQGYTVTISDGTLTNSPLTRTQIYGLFEGLSEVTLYGATNKHPVITDSASMWREVPSVWAITNTGATGSNLLGTFWYTNTQNLIREGNYIGRLWATESGAGSSEIVIELVYTVDNGVTTNLISRSTSSGTVGGTLASYRLTCAIETNMEFATTPAYLGVKCYQVRGAQASTIVIYGGTNYETHLETPGLGSANGYVLDSTFNAYTGAVADVLYGTVSNWSYYPAKSTVNMAGLAGTNFGSIGIGPIIPTLKLDIAASILNDGAMRILGIPQTSLVKLQVVDTDGGAGYVGTEGGTPTKLIANNTPSIEISGSDQSVSFLGHAATNAANFTSTGACSFATTGGNVGIGTANPNATLDVNGSIIASNDLTVAGNLIAHGSLAMGYLVCSNNTNEIVWSGPFSRTTTLTNLYWCSSVGAATGTVFTAANATALSAWDSICYTGIACDVTTPSNAPVAITVTAGHRLGTMVSASTNYTLAVQW